MTVAGETHRCPPSEVLAAFVDARLPKKQVEALADHLSSCAECRFIVESASEFQAEEQAEVTEPQGGGAWRWLAIAAVIGGGFFLTPVPRMMWQTHVREATMRELVDAPLKKRLIEPRLTGGFRYGEWGVNRGPGDEEEPIDQMIAKDRAGQVITKTKNDPSADAARDRGVAWLVLNNADKAIKELTTVTEKQPRDARAWSDLAAAYIQKQQYSKAITAANRALALDPKLKEARFNKALATERLVPAESIREWTEYLKHDPYGLWALEARQMRKRAQEPP